MPRTAPSEVSQFVSAGTNDPEAVSVGDGGSEPRGQTLVDQGVLRSEQQVLD